MRAKIEQAGGDNTAVHDFWLNLLPLSRCEVSVSCYILPFQLELTLIDKAKMPPKYQDVVEELHRQSATAEERFEELQSAIVELTQQTHEFQERVDNKLQRVLDANSTDSKSPNC